MEVGQLTGLLGAWLADSIKRKHKEEKVIRLESPLPQLPDS